MLIFISALNPLLQCIELEFRFSPICLHQELDFAKWRPGRYEWANYMRSIFEISCVFENGEPCSFQLQGERLYLHNQDLQEVVLSFRVHCGELNAGSSWISPTFYYFNFINFIPSVQGLEDEPISLKIDFPEEFNVKTTLFQKTKKEYVATNYDELVDSPFLASTDLKIFNYRLKETVFTLCVQGDFPFEEAKVLLDFEKFSQVQLDLFGYLPSEEYCFYLIMLPYRHYHGVEHHNSTVIVLGPTKNQTSLYSELLGISSHELFHAWNVKRIQPQQFVPYQYHEPVYHKEGFVTEGFTTYYGDLMLLRSAVFTFSEYAAEMNTTLQRVFWNDGRKVSSLVESSQLLWCNGYKPSLIENKVSIYAEGSLVAWMLDVEIRKTSSNQFSLDDLMRSLWQDCQQRYSGYTLEIVLQKLNEITGVSFESFFAKYVFGKEVMLADFSHYLAYLGLKIKQIPNENARTRLMGFVLNVKNEIDKIAVDSPVWDVLMKGDLLVNESLETDNYCCGILRMGKEIKFRVPYSDSNSFYPTYLLEKSENMTEEQFNNFSSWIKK